MTPIAITKTTAVTAPTTALDMSLFDNNERETVEINDGTKTDETKTSVNNEVENKDETNTDEINDQTTENPRIQLRERTDIKNETDDNAKQEVNSKKETPSVRFSRSTKLDDSSTKPDNKNQVTIPVIPRTIPNITYTDESKLDQLEHTPRMLRTDYKKPNFKERISRDFKGNKSRNSLSTKSEPIVPKYRFEVKSTEGKGSHLLQIDDDEETPRKRNSIFDILDDEEKAKFRPKKERQKTSSGRYKDGEYLTNQGSSDRMNTSRTESDTSQERRTGAKTLKMRGKTYTLQQGDTPEEEDEREIVVDE